MVIGVRRTYTFTRESIWNLPQFGGAKWTRSEERIDWHCPAGTIFANNPSMKLSEYDIITL